MRKITFEQYKTELLNLFKSINSEFNDKGIVWFAHSGTLLGAKRNNEFIPWDDDIDMGMTSKEFYSKKEIIKDISKKYNLSLADKIEHIGLNNSRLISNEKILVDYKGKEYLTSLFIDIMIAIPIKHRKQFVPFFWYVSCRLMQIFSTFWRPLPKYKSTKANPKKISVITQILVFIARIFISPLLILHFVEKRTIKKSINKNHKNYIFHYGWSNLGIFYTESELNNLSVDYISGEKIYVNDNWKEELIIRYGENFERLPDISKRIPHHITLTPYEGNEFEYSIFPHIIK